MPDKIITIRVREGKKLSEVTLRERQVIDLMAEAIYGEVQLVNKSISDDAAVNAAYAAIDNVMKKGV